MASDIANWMTSTSGYHEAILEWKLEPPTYTDLYDAFLEAIESEWEEDGDGSKMEDVT